MYLMKRNYLWAMWTLGPILLLTLFIGYPELIIDFVVYTDNNFLMSNWWKLLGGLVILNWLFFLTHAILNKKLIWFLALLLFQLLPQPFYWWFNSENT